MDFEADYHDICKECFVAFVQIEIVSAKVEFIKCPHCEVILSQELIESLVSKDIWNKYLKYKLNLSIISDPLARWCPTPNCVNIIRLTERNQKEAKCLACCIVICAKCNRELHPGTTCEKQMQQDIQQWESNKDISKCPKCRMIVEKVDGCNHMTCPACSYEFCWLCDSSYTPYHFNRWNPLGCPGLQSGNHQARYWSIGMILILRILYTLGLLIYLPIFMIFWFPKVFVNYVSRKCQFDRINCCIRGMLYITCEITGLLLDAVVIPLIILYGIPNSIWHLVSYIKYRCKLSQRVKERMKTRKGLAERQGNHNNRPIEENNQVVLQVRN